MGRIKRIIKEIFKVLGRDEIQVLPAHLAFFLVLSVVPIIALIGVIASFFSVSLDLFIDLIRDALPVEISDIIITYISGKGLDLQVGLSMIIVFIIASNGAHSIIITSNALYHIPNSSYISRRIKAFFMTILMVFLFLFIIIVLAFGNHILNAIMSFESLKDLNYLYDIFVLLKWPLSYFLILFSLKILFTVAPDAKIPSKYMNAGVRFTTLGWVLVTAIYSFYVNHFANYDIFYGGLSNIIILMMWIYMLAYILVIGIAINTNRYNEAIINEKEENNSENNKKLKKII